MNIGIHTITIRDTFVTTEAKLYDQTLHQHRLDLLLIQTLFSSYQLVQYHVPDSTQH